MNEKKPASLQKIVGLLIGAVVALAFAVWSITNAMKPPTPSAKTAAATITTPPPTDTAAPPPAAAEQPGVSVSEAAPQPSEPGGEAGLAPGADPFSPLPFSEVVSTPAPPPAPPEQAVRRPSAQPLPAVTRGPFPLPSLEVAPINSSGKKPPSVDEEPELAGTLLGEQPSAVFRSDANLVVVPVGGSFKAWRVVAVDHGQAVVKKDRRMLRLAVGGRLQAGAITVTVTNEPAVAAADSPVVPVAPEEKRGEDPSSHTVPSDPLEQPKLPEDTSSTAVQPENEPDKEPLPPAPGPTIP